MKYLWRIFSSVRLAIWTILLLALVSLAGSLSLFDVFHSPVFFILGTILIINIAVCSLKRWSSLLAASRGVTMESAARLLAKGATNTQQGTSKRSQKDTAEAAVTFLAQRGYRQRRQTVTGTDLLAGDKNRFAPWGTYAIHLSLILLVAGYLMGSYFGYNDDSFIVAENQTRAITGYPFSLYLDSFEDEYWPDGSPKDFRSQVKIIENGLVVKEALVRVNHPLEYKGLKIFQSFYGPAVAVTVKDIDGNPVFQDSVVFSTSLSDQGFVWPFGTFTLPGNNLYCAIISSAGPSDPIIPSGELRLEFYDIATVEFLDSFPLAVGMPVEYQGLFFSADSMGQFSGFQIKEDPGLVLIWIAFALFMAGLFLVFYFPHRQIIISIQPGQAGSSYSYTFLGKKSLFTDEIKSLVEALNSADVETPERKSRK